KWERASESFRRFTSADGVPRSAPTAFVEDSAGNLWIGFYTGDIVRYKDGHFQLISLDSSRTGTIRAIYLDREKRLWIATGDDGVARIDDPLAEHPKPVMYRTAEGLASNQATCVTEDKWGRIYIGTGRGVDRFDPNTNHIY